MALKIIVEPEVKAVVLVDLNQAEQMQQLLAKKTPEVEVEVEAIAVLRTMQEKPAALEL